MGGGFDWLDNEVKPLVYLTRSRVEKFLPVVLLGLLESTACRWKIAGRHRKA